MSEENTFPIGLELMRSALEATNDGVVIADATKEDCPLIYVNPAFSCMTGYSSEEALGRNCRFLQGDDRAQPALDELRKALASGSDCRVTLRNFRKDGTPFWNELHISPILEGERVVFFVGVQADVTARIEAERRSEELQSKLELQNAELRKLNETKNEFVGMAAHDLRNPLTTIVLNSEMLRKKLAATDSDSDLEKASMIQNAAEHMLSLVNGLLDISKIEAGHMELSLESISLLEAVLSSVALHRNRAEEKDIDLQTELNMQDTVMMAMDRHKIRQVLDNLISNALKYSAAGSKVRVKVEADGEEARVSVSDTGQGIAESELKKIFEPFGRAEGTKPTGGESSTGLGLSISRKIAEAHGGRIQAASSVGKGSTFTLSLPVKGKQ